MERSNLLSEELLSLDLTRIAGRHDSGVASPTEEFPTARVETPANPASDSTQRSTQKKQTRLTTGEDAGIGGSDHGE